MFHQVIITHRRFLVGAGLLALFLATGVALPLATKHLFPSHPIDNRISQPELKTKDPSVTRSPIAVPQASPQFELSQKIIAGGGGTTAGGSLRLDGTVGQATAGAQSSGGRYTLNGGFWQAQLGVSGTPTPTPTPTSTFQFSAANFSVGEGDGHVSITVTRSGDITASAGVSFATSDNVGAQSCSAFNGSASARCDYHITFGTLQFGPTEMSKTFSVAIIDDSYAEGTETFAVSLNNPTGATLGALSTTTVTIMDNDSVTGANPIDTAAFFVRLHYLDFLNREPDSSGLQFWIGNITVCGSDAECLAVRRINVSAAFYLSIEFQQTGYLVERIYKTAYGDANGASTFNGPHQLAVPIVRLNEFLADTQQIGEGVVVLQPGWEQILENNKQAFTAGFVQRSRFAVAFPTSLPPVQFVDTLFANAGVTPSAAERQAAIDEFGGANSTADLSARGRALRRVAENATLAQQEFNRAFVLMQYFGYLRRNPDDPQDSDYTGYDFWLTKLNEFNGDFVKAEMVKAFINSQEYRQRFGP
jgi:hypothetical protein